MGNVDAFLKMLLTFNKDAVPVPCVEKVEKDFISNLAFNADSIRTKSGAAAGLCSWVINICKYFRIYQVCLALSSHSHMQKTSPFLMQYIRNILKAGEWLKLLIAIAVTAMSLGYR